MMIRGVFWLMLKKWNCKIMNSATPVSPHLEAMDDDDDIAA